ncbi:protein kinase domain-containing protein [Gordonia sp. MMO-8]|uniref:protein kinase domain-containing protein n=1 Tax=Gordonia sp. MMO-8 TaxID=3127886 RepID=UPI00301AE9F7
MADSERWVEVSKSAFAHETEGLRILRDVVPDASPYRAWTNFEFMDSHGGWNEIDALVLGRSRLHMVELKSYNGVLSGNEQMWTLTGRSRHPRSQRSALLTTRRKAQKLASRLDEEVRKIAVQHGLNVAKVMQQFPWVQESVFFHGDSFTVDLSDLAKSNLFGIDGRENVTRLPGIHERILEAPNGRNGVISEDMSVIIALALRELGASRRTERDAGSWTLTGSTLERGDDWQEFVAVHKVTGEKARGRVVTTRRGAAPQAKANAHRRVQREYTLIKSLHQESIVPPHDLAQDDDGNTVLIYPTLAGYEPLDLAVMSKPLTADQQVAVLAAVTDALAYAHRNQVANRGLSPSTVLLNTELLAETGEVQVRLADWSWSGRVHGADTPSSTMLGAPGTSETEVYQAPEDRWSPSADRVAVDLFSLGSLAYFLFSGEPPASTRSELLARLRTENGLDLAASGGAFVNEQLRALVLQATRPSVSERIKADPKTHLPRYGAVEFRADLEQFNSDLVADDESPEADPLNPVPGDSLADGRFEVIKVLGAGSTARGVLVADHDNAETRRVLKVALNDQANIRLQDEAAVLDQLGALDAKVPGVVEIVEPPMTIADRAVLVLTDCGEQTLADVVRHMPAGEPQLKAWGTALLDTVVALDSAGIAHRDIKPSNIGMTKASTGRGKGAKTKPALFDFSLSRAGVTDIEAGTPPYRDPFLGTGTRQAFDSAAERYAVAVVLFEMATTTTPIYGDGLSDPRAINDDVTIDIDDFVDSGFTLERAEALGDFFRIALARDSRKRHDTASAMRDAWIDVFATASRGAAPKPVPVKPTVVVEISDEPLDLRYSSLGELITSLTDMAGRKPTVVRRHVIELVLGTREGSPADPFAVYGDLAERVGVTSGRVAQIFGEIPSLLTSDDPIRAASADRLRATFADLENRVRSMIADSGGASTPGLVAEGLLASMSTVGVEEPRRVALGLLRLVLACGSVLADETSPTIDMVRRHGAGTVAMLSTGTVDRRLPAALSQVAHSMVEESAKQGLRLVPASDVDPVLRRAATAHLKASPGDADLPARVLLSIAVTASADLELTARSELYDAGLSVGEMLSLVLSGATDRDFFTRRALEDRVDARFPARRGAFPNRPKLDELVVAAVPGLEWNSDASQYRFPTESTSRGSTVQTYRSTIARTSAQHPADHIDVLSVDDRRFRALGVPLGKCDAVADALCERFGAVRVDVTDVLLSAMRSKAASVGLDWNMILAADAGSPADREGLKGFVAQTVSAVVDAVSAVDGPVVLTDLSTLSAYGQLGIVSTWTDLATPPPYSIWATIPQPAAAGGGGPLVDDIALPLNSPEQFLPLTANDVSTLVAKEPSA